MTAPVIVGQKGEGGWKMAFTMPSQYTMDSLPRPLDQRVSLLTMPAKTLAVIRYSGSFNNLKARKERAMALVAWVERSKKYRLTATPFFAGYDPPYTLPFLRRNEVLVEIADR